MPGVDGCASGAMNEVRLSCSCLAVHRLGYVSCRDVCRGCVSMATRILLRYERVQNLAIVLDGFVSNEVSCHMGYVGLCDCALRVSVSAGLRQRE